VSKSNNAKKQREKQKFWSTYINAWKESGFSQAEYCRHQNLKSYQLSYWINRKSYLNNSLPVLVETPIKENAPQSVSASSLQLVTRYGEQININDNFSAESFEKVIQVLRRLSWLRQQTVFGSFWLQVAQICASRSMVFRFLLTNTN